MCGICGYSKLNEAIDKRTFDKMTDVVAHRGPDGRGVFYDNGVALGHRRLSIIDLSSEAAQPFEYKDRYVCVFNGEIFNYIELREELKEKGYSFKTSSDTEVLIAAYDYYGEKCVSHFNGMWAFCIYDKEKKILFCSRDRFGVKPFYYTERSGAFIFASEIKQLLLWENENPRADIETLRRFIVLGEQDASDKTMFFGIEQLCGGSNLTYDIEKSTVSITKWYNASFEEEAIDYDEAKKRVRRAFDDAVRLRLRADVPVGSCLSGGIDSSAIVGAVNSMLRLQGDEKLQHTVSSCYEDKAYNEQAYLNDVLDKTKAYSHKIYPKNDDISSWIDNVIWHMDEPIGSASGYSQWSVFKEARRAGLTVMLDGQGADEQLAGYSQFGLVYLVHLASKGKIKQFFKTVKELKNNNDGLRAMSTLMVTTYCFAKAVLPKCAVRLLNRFAILARKPRLYWSREWSNLLLNCNEYKKMTPCEYVRNSVNSGLKQLLHSEDRNSMANSVESRVPFMDVNFVECCARLPFEYKLKNGVTKAVFREAVKDYLPESVYNRNGKMGFPAPTNRWMLNNRDWFTEQIENACGRFPSILPKERTMKCYHRFLDKPQEGEFLWWRIMCVNRWAEVFGVVE